MKKGLLQDEHLLLRPSEPEDLDIMYQIENDTELWEVGSVSIPFSRYSLKEYIANSQNDLFIDRQLRLIIVAKEIDQIIGIIDISDFDPIHNRASVGIVVLKQFRKLGFAGKAIKLLKEYCFQYLHLNQLYAYIPEDNTDSIKLFNSYHFVSSALLKQWIRSSDGYKNALLVQCMNEEG